MRWLRKHLATLLPAIIFILGLLLLAYPRFSNWWNERHQSRAIAGYETIVESTDDADLDAMLAAAEAYNARLLERSQSDGMTLGMLSDEETEEYNSLLDLEGNGIMGYVRIPKIDVRLPIYHGTDDAVLQVAIGHIEGSSLPVGGTGTHSVISGHRGLTSAKLFTDIDQLGIGDVFIITVLNRKITYEVDQILTVLPEEVDSLEIDPDEDYCTLVTCTPYGINTHRLLVRGHRIANLVDDQIKDIQIEVPEREYSFQERLQRYLPYALILAAGFFFLALILPTRRRDEEQEEQEAWERNRRRHRSRSGYDDYDDGYDEDADPRGGRRAVKRRYGSRPDPDSEWERRRQEMMRRREYREREAYEPERYDDEIEYDDGYDDADRYDNRSRGRNDDRGYRQRRDERGGRYRETDREPRGGEAGFYDDEDEWLD